MDMKTVKELNKVYEAKMIEEGFMVDETVGIYIATNTLLDFEVLVGSEADNLTYGEFTRRFNSAMEELQGLIKA